MELSIVNSHEGPLLPQSREASIDIQTDALSKKPIWKFLYLVGGVFFFFLLYGICQERIFRNEQLQKYSWYITLIQFFFYSTFSTIGNNVAQRNMPLRYYLIIAFLTVTTMACSNSSLQYLSYPTQVIFKSSKLVPVMIGGVFIQGKKYGLLDYSASFMMTIGLIFFTLADSSLSAKKTQMEGLFLICTALSADAVIGNVQEKWIHRYRAANAEVIFYSYGIGALLITFKLVFLDLTFMEATYYCLQNFQDSYFMTFCFAISGYLGVKFVLDLIRDYGALIAVTVTTCRKAVTLILSYVIFPKHISNQHIFSGLLVLLGVCLNVYTKNKASLRAFYDANIRPLLYPHSLPAYYKHHQQV